MTIKNTARYTQEITFTDVEDITAGLADNMFSLFFMADGNEVEAQTKFKVQDKFEAFTGDETTVRVHKDIDGTLWLMDYK